MNVPGPGTIPVMTPGASPALVSGMVAAALEHVLSMPGGAPLLEPLLLLELVPPLELVPLLEEPVPLLVPLLEAAPLLEPVPPVEPLLLVTPPLLEPPLPLELLAPPEVPPSTAVPAPPGEEPDEQPYRASPIKTDHPSPLVPFIRWIGMTDQALQDQA
jgi:hypothetical protein